MDLSQRHDTALYRQPKDRRAHNWGRVHKFRLGLDLRGRLHTLRQIGIHIILCPHDQDREPPVHRQCVVSSYNNIMT